MLAFNDYPMTFFTFYYSGSIKPILGGNRLSASGARTPGFAPIPFGECLFAPHFQKVWLFAPIPYGEWFFVPMLLTVKSYSCQWAMALQVALKEERIYWSLSFTQPRKRKTERQFFKKTERSEELNPLRKKALSEVSTSHFIRSFLFSPFLPQRGIRQYRGNQSYTYQKKHSKNRTQGLQTKVAVLKKKHILFVKKSKNLVKNERSHPR